MGSSHLSFGGRQTSFEASKIAPRCCTNACLEIILQIPTLQSQCTGFQAEEEEGGEEEEEWSIGTDAQISHLLISPLRLPSLPYHEINKWYKEV